MASNKPTFHLPLHNLTTTTTILRHQNSLSNPSSARAKTYSAKTKTILAMIKTDPKTCRFCSRTSKITKQNEGLKSPCSNIGNIRSFKSKFDIDIITNSNLHHLNNNHHHRTASSYANLTNNTYEQYRLSGTGDGLAAYCIDDTCSNSNSNSNSNINNQQSFQNFSQMINKALYAKYSSSQNYYYTKDITDILNQSRTYAVIKYKDILTYDEDEEFLKRYYKQYEWKNKIKLLSEYYKFHRDIARLFMQPTINIINKYHDKKRRIEYVKITKMLKEQEETKNGYPNNPNNKDPLVCNDNNNNKKKPSQHEKKPNEGQHHHGYKKDDILIYDRILDNLDLTIKDEHYTTNTRDDEEETAKKKNIKIKNKGIDYTESSKPNNNKNSDREHVNLNKDKNPKVEKSTENSNIIQDLNNKLSEIISNSCNYTSNHYATYNFDTKYFDSVNSIVNLESGNNISSHKDQYSMTNLTNFLMFISKNPNNGELESSLKMPLNAPISKKYHEEANKPSTKDSKNENFFHHTKKVASATSLDQLVTDSAPTSSRKNDNNNNSNNTKPLNSFRKNKNSVQPITTTASTTSIITAKNQENNNNLGGEYLPQKSINQNGQNSSNGSNTYRSQPSNDFRCISPELPNLPSDIKQDLASSVNHLGLGVISVTDNFVLPREIIINTPCSTQNGIHMVNEPQKSSRNNQIQMNLTKKTPEKQSPQSQIQKIKNFDLASSNLKATSNNLPLSSRENSATRRPPLQNNPIYNSINTLAINQAKTVFSSPRDIDTQNNKSLYNQNNGFLTTRADNGNHNQKGFQATKNSINKGQPNLLKKESNESITTGNIISESNTNTNNIKKSTHNRANSHTSFNTIGLGKNKPFNQPQGQGQTQTQQQQVLGQTGLNEDRKKMSINLPLSKCWPMTTTNILNQGILTQNSARHKKDEFIEVELPKSAHRHTKSDLNLIKISQNLQAQQEILRKTNVLGLKSQTEIEKNILYNNNNNRPITPLSELNNIQLPLHEIAERSPNQTKKFNHTKTLSKQGNTIYTTGASVNSPNIANKGQMIYNINELKTRKFDRKTGSSLSPDKIFFNDIQNGQPLLNSPIASNHNNPNIHPQHHHHNMYSYANTKSNPLTNMYLNSQLVITPINAGRASPQSDMLILDMQHNRLKSRNNNNVEKFKNDYEPVIGSVNNSKKTISAHTSPLKTFNKPTSTTKNISGSKVNARKL